MNQNFYSNTARLYRQWRKKSCFILQQIHGAETRDVI